MRLAAKFERIVDGTWWFHFVHKLTLNQSLQNTLVRPWLGYEILTIVNENHSTWLFF